MGRGNGGVCLLIAASFHNKDITMEQHKYLSIENKVENVKRLEKSESASFLAIVRDEEGYVFRL